jgi:hypothetical protein
MLQEQSAQASPQATQGLIEPGRGQLAFGLA